MCSDGMLPSLNRDDQAEIIACNPQHSSTTVYLHIQRQLSGQDDTVLKLQLFADTAFWMEWSDAECLIGKSGISW